MRTLYHRTITVTAPLLRKLGACEGAIISLSDDGILPARVSTDPEDNLDLAIKLTEEGQAYRVWWLLALYVDDAGMSPDYYDVVSTFVGLQRLPLVQQVLAIFADRYLTGKLKTAE